MLESARLARELSARRQSSPPIGRQLQMIAQTAPATVYKPPPPPTGRRRRQARPAIIVIVIIAYWPTRAHSARNTPTGLSTLGPLWSRAHLPTGLAAGAAARPQIPLAHGRPAPAAPSASYSRAKARPAPLVGAAAPDRACQCVAGHLRQFASPLFQLAARRRRRLAHRAGPRADPLANKLIVSLVSAAAVLVDTSGAGHISPARPPPP